MDLEAGKSHLIETTTVNTENIPQMFDIPINRFREFNYDSTMRWGHSEEEKLDCAMNSDMTILELVENISKCFSKVLYLLSAVKE
ncbi:MAG: hypothetical protein J6J11_04535 [Treponema sp.]|nr:hypothetical protein [Treponema sp.]